MARSRNVAWDYTGEAFVKALDPCCVWLRLNGADEEEKDNITAVWKEDAKKLLQEAMVRLAPPLPIQSIALRCFTGRHR